MSLGTVLTIDDESSIRSLIKNTLENENIDVIEAASGKEALHILKTHSIDLILLDIIMNDINGLDLLRDIQRIDFPYPIIIVSTKSNITDQIIGLGVGADDYITKPFKPSLLSAKVKAHLRLAKRMTASVAKPQKITAGPFMFDLESLSLFKNGERITLSTKETMLIKLFMENIDRVFSKTQLYELVWQNNIVDDNTIMVYISKLREKIEDDSNNPKYLVTLRGLGYKFTIEQNFY